MPFQPWAKALYDYRQSRTDLYPPLVHCKPSGGPGFFNAPGFEIVEVPEQQRVFILNIAGPHSWRVIYMDGRPHPTELRPTYLGHSIGKWDGNTLVDRHCRIQRKTMDGRQLPDDGAAAPD